MIAENGYERAVRAHSGCGLIPAHIPPKSDLFTVEKTPCEHVCTVNHMAPIQIPGAFASPSELFGGVPESHPPRLQGKPDQP